MKKTLTYNIAIATLLYVVLTTWIYWGEELDTNVKGNISIVWVFVMFATTIFTALFFDDEKQNQ